MKLLTLFAVSSLLIVSCSEKDNLVTPPEVMKGSIFIASSPSGAEIWLQGVNTSQVTPDTLIDLTPGSYLVTLKLQNYKDTTLVVSVGGGQITSIIVTLMTNFGSIFVSSNPEGAEIWLDGVNISQVTPDTIKNLNEGVYNVTLKLTDYNDATFSVSVTAGQTSDLTNVVLVSNLMTTLFGPVRIYESFGTTSSQPSGLDLSSGIAYGISSTEQDSVDIYYSTDGTGGRGFLIQSADLTPNLIRKTDFLVGNSTNLFDEEDSPPRNTVTWTNNIGDREVNYVFLYDNDGHYSKLIIVSSSGGGVPGEPAWVAVMWYYNETILDNRF